MKVRVMRLQISRSKNSESFYVIRSVYEKGKRTTVVYEKLGTLQEVKEKAGSQDPYEWARVHVADLNRKEKESAESNVTITLSPDADLDSNNRIKYKAGHLFLQKLYYQMGWNRISGMVKAGTDSEIPLNTILQMLLYTRILYPRGKSPAASGRQGMGSHSGKQRPDPGIRIQKHRKLLQTEYGRSLL